MYSQALADNACSKPSFSRLKDALCPISLNATLPNNQKLNLEN